MLDRGKIINKDTNSLYIDTYSNKIKLFFESNEIDKFNIGDLVVFHSIDQSTLENSDQEYLSLNFTKNMKIFKDPFKTISDLQKDKYNDIIAVCTKYKSLIPTKGTDFVFSLDLIDLTGAIELKVFTTQEEFQGFLNNSESADRPFTSGETLLIRNVKKSNRESVALIYKPCLISKIKDFKDLSDPSLFIQKAIAQILDSKLNSNFMLKILASKKNLQIQDLKDHCFFNILGKVITCDYDVVPSIKITDFTVNPNIQDSQNSFPDSMTLIIKLFGQHSYLVDKIERDKYYFFMNIRCRTFSPFIIAYMHDSLEGDIIPVTSDSFLKEIRSREEKYKEGNGNLKIFDNGHFNVFTNNRTTHEESSINNNNSYDNSNCNLNINNTDIKNDIINNIVFKGNNVYNMEGDNVNFNGNDPSDNTNTIGFKRDNTISIDNTNDNMSFKNHNMYDCNVNTSGTGDNTANNCNKIISEIKTNEKNIPTDLPSNGEITIESKNTEDLISKFLPTLKIKNIKDPGVYLSLCHLTNIWHSPDINNLYSILKVKEEEREYQLKTKRNLTKKLLLNENITVDKSFRCLILLVGTGDLYMIDIFVDEEDFKKFVLFYVNSIDKGN